MASCNGGSNGYTLTLNYNQGSQNVAGNYSTVNWELVFSCGQYYYQNSSTIDNFKAYINGTCVYNQNRAISFPGQNRAIVIASGSINVGHNADGTKTIGTSASFSPGKSASYYPGAISCSGALTLSTIPRASVIGTVSFSNFWSAFRVTYTKYYSGFVCKLRVSIPTVEMLQTFDGYNSGASVAFSSSVQNTIMNKLINAGSIKLGFVIETWSGGTKIGESTESVITIYKPAINQISSVPNFNVDDGFSISLNRTYPNYASYIDIYIGNKNVYAGYINDSHYVSFNSTQLQTIYSQMANTNSATFVIYVTSFYNGINCGNVNVSRTGTITGAIPTFDGFSWETINNLTLHDNQTIIKGKSNVMVTIQQATAYKGASISYYQVTIGNVTSKVTSLSATLNNVDSNIITVYAVDTRGNTASKQMSCNKYIEYVPVTLDALNYVRGSGGIGADVNIDFNGSSFIGDFGLQNNTITATYFYKETNTSDYTQGTSDITPHLSSKYSKEVAIKGDLGANGFTIDKNFNLRVIISDKLTTAYRDIVVAKGKPALAISDDGVATGGFYDENIGGALQVYGGATQNGFNILNTSNGVTKDADVVAHMTTKNGYLGFDNATGDWLRTPTAGLLPNVPGVASSIGSSGWRFASGYFQDLDITRGVSANTMYTSNWYRSYGATGWYNETYKGGIYMQDSEYVRVYNGKGFWCDGNVYANDVVSSKDTTAQALWTYALSYGLIYGMQWGNAAHGYIHVWSNVGTYGINVWASDKSLKEHIKDTEIKHALDKISQLEHVEFDWKDGGKCELGYVADDIEKVLPCLVHEVEQKEDEETGITSKPIKHINHTTLLPLVTMGMQELIQENKYLWEFNNAVVEEVCVLKERLDKLEKLLSNKENS